MPRPRNLVPKYTLHKPSGNARVQWTGVDGCRHSRDFGPFGSPESREKYERFLAEFRAADATHQLACKTKAPGELTVAELMEQYRLWAVGYYRRADGTQTNEVKEIAESVLLMYKLYGSSLVCDFGPVALRAVRQAMIDRDWCRTLINRRVGRIKRGFRWGVSQELVSAVVFQALETVDGLKKGRSTARESKPVGPVSTEHINAIKPHVLPEVWTMIELQRLTAMRPQDVCGLRPSDLDRTGKLWAYVPDQHKGTHRGKIRIIKIGPRAQELLLPLLEGLKPEEYVFSPARAVTAWRVRLRKARVSKVQPSQIERLKAHPLRKPGNRYKPCRYAEVIWRACEKAGIPSWGPNRLRHTAATEIRKEFGLEAAQVFLGHERADVTQLYAEKNMQFYDQIVSKVG